MFKVGDKVLCNIIPEERNIIRTVVEIHPFHNQSGFSMSADGGEPCKLCGKLGKQINNIDSSWFKLYKE
jgi:hypothetical protein